MCYLVFSKLYQPEWGAACHAAGSVRRIQLCHIWASGLQEHAAVRPATAAFFKPVSPHEVQKVTEHNYHVVIESQTILASTYLCAPAYP